MIMLKQMSQATADRLSGFGWDIPWELIIQLVEWVIENCFQSAQAFMDAAKDPTGFQMWILRRQAIKRLRLYYRGRELRQAANALCSVMLEQASRASDKELKKIFRESV
jgi:hypothetical protein